MPTRTLQRLNLALYLVSTVLNFGSQWLYPMQNRDPRRVATLLDPAGYAFSIWAVIFGGMIWHSWRQLQRPLPAEPAVASRLRITTIGLLLAAVATILFVPITFWDAPLVSWADIVLHLTGLLLAYLALRSLPERPFWQHHWPVSIFLGWICVALVVSTSITLAKLGWQPGLAVSSWLAVAVSVVVFFLGGFFLDRYRDYLFTLTLAWGLLGIYAEQAGNAPSRAVSAALTGAVLLVILCGWYRWRARPNTVI